MPRTRADLYYSRPIATLQQESPSADSARLGIPKELLQAGRDANLVSAMAQWGIGEPTLAVLGAPLSQGKRQEHLDVGAALQFYQQQFTPTRSQLLQYELVLKHRRAACRRFHTHRRQ